MSTFDLGPVRALRPDERDDAPVVGIGEFFNATWEEGRKASNFDAHLKNYSDAFDGIADRVKAATGEALDNPFRSATFGQAAELLTTFSREAVDASSPVTAWRQRVRELQAKHADKLDWDSLIDEPGKVAFASMKKAREDADALAERAGMIAPRDVPVLGGVPVVNSIAALGVNAVRHPGYTAAQLAAGFGAQMTSPADAAVNLISFGVGGTAKSIIKNATMNALSNAAGQALLSGPKQIAYQSAGLPYGWGVWAEEVGAAAGAGFAIDAGIRTPIRAAVNRFGRDTEAGTLFSRNTARGGFFLDAVTDATPTPRVRPTLDIDPETIKKAEAGDIAASKEILEKTGAMNDPAVRYAVDHIEGGGKLTDEALRVLESMGVARPDGMRLLADALTGRMPEAMPEPVRAADAPLMPERGAPLLGRLAEVQDQVARLPARVQEAVADGLEAGLPAVVRAVEDAFAGPRETFPERVAQALDARTIAAARLHGGRAGAVEAARYIRQFPDLIDDTVPLETGRIEQARAIARLDDGAFAAVAEGAVPPEVAALISSRVPKAQQSRVIGDIEKARPRSMAEAADLIETLTMPERVGGELAPGARIDDPSGPEAKAHLEALRGEAGPAYEAAMAPIRRRDELESEIETKRGQIAKLEQEAQKAPDSPETKEGASPDEQIAAARAELRDLEAELAQVQGEIDPSPGGQQLYRVAMRALALRREADVIRAINDALDTGRRMTPEGTRIDVVNEIDAGGGRVADAVAMPDGSIQLAIAAVDPMARIGHEAVHVLVTKGHLSPDEVAALAALAREAGTFKDEAAYRETYADRQSLDRLIEEESAASYIEARIKGTVKGPPNTVVERIRQLMERIKQLLAGYGFQSREDVVQAIMSGDAARRDARAEWMRDAQTQGRKAMADAAERGVDLPDGTRVDGVPLFAIRAFHGSPHDFDRFSLDKIGTGEGAQAYGHGLYFAENDAVAKMYRDQLSQSRNVATRFEPRSEIEASFRRYVDMAQSADGGTLSDVRSEIAAAVKAGRMPAEAVPQFDAMVQEGRLAFASPGAGRMYEVSIKADPEDFLDWDKPLSQQSETVRKTIEPALGKAAADLGKGADPQKIAQLEAMGLGNIARRMMPKEIDPWSIDVQTLAKQYPDALREAGIPGIKYLDQGPRGLGDGSRNYVVFDDSLIDIVAKDGQPVLGQDITAATVKDGKLYAFAGERARTADRVALAHARVMEKAGRTRDQIWQETGWFKGVDGKWRFEIHDRPFIVREGVGFGQILHAGLMDAYEGVADLPAGVGADDNVHGLTNMRTGEVDEDGNPVGPMILVLGPPETWKETALHELQHVVQKEEGFATGGSRDTAAMFVEGVPALNAAMEDARARLKAAKKKLTKRIPLTKAWREVRAARMAFRASDKVLNDALDRVGAKSPEERRALYERLAGEVEARMVEKRLSLSQDERKARPPWLDYDVPESEQIVVLRNDGVQESAYNGVRNPTHPVNAEFDPSKSDSPNLMYAIRSDEPSLKQDMATVDRMNRIGELIQACRA